MPRPLPLGEVASRSDDGEGEDANRGATASGYDPTCEKVNRENPQIFPIYKLQINFPLMMRRATRSAF